MKAVKSVSALISAIEHSNKKPVFDYDQVLYDHGQLNTELLDAIRNAGFTLRLATHGSSAQATCPISFEEVEHETILVLDGDLPKIDDQGRPIVAKALDDEYVLIDDRAEEWAVVTGKDNYIQYKFQI